MHMPLHKPFGTWRSAPAVYCGLSVQLTGYWLFLPVTATLLMCADAFCCPLAASSSAHVPSFLADDSTYDVPLGRSITGFTLNTAPLIASWYPTSHNRIVYTSDRAFPLPKHRLECVPAFSLRRCASQACRSHAPGTSTTPSPSTTTHPGHYTPPNTNPPFLQPSNPVAAVAVAVADTAVTKATVIPSFSGLLEVDVAGCTKKGFMFGGGKLCNQDRGVIVEHFRAPGELLLGVLDGHGGFGHMVSAYLMYHLPQVLLKKLTGSCHSGAHSSKNQKHGSLSSKDCSTTGSITGTDGDGSTRFSNASVTASLAMRSSGSGFTRPMKPDLQLQHTFAEAFATADNMLSGSGVNVLESGSTCALCHIQHNPVQLKQQQTQRKQAKGKGSANSGPKKQEDSSRPPQATSALVPSAAPSSAAASAQAPPPPAPSAPSTRPASPFVPATSPAASTMTALASGRKSPLLTNTLFGTERSALPFDTLASVSSTDIEQPPTPPPAQHPQLQYLLQPGVLTVTTAWVGDSRVVVGRRRKSGAATASAAPAGSTRSAASASAVTAADGRSALGQAASASVWQAIPVTLDHKPDRPDEKVRVLLNGGRVEPMKDANDNNVGPARVWFKHLDYPGLAMSRSFGDLPCRRLGVGPDPEMLQLHVRVTDPCVDDTVMVVASDGVWDYMSNEEVVKLVSSYSEAAAATEALVAAADKKWRERETGKYVDDITAIVAMFRVK